MKKGVTALQNVQLLKWCANRRDAVLEPPLGLPRRGAFELRADGAARAAPRAPRAAVGRRRPAPRPLQPRLRRRRAARLPRRRARCRRTTRSTFPPDRLAGSSPSRSRAAAQEAAEYVAPLLRALARWKSASTAASALFSVPAGDALYVFDLRAAARRRSPSSAERRAPPLGVRRTIDERPRGRRESPLGMRLRARRRSARSPARARPPRLLLEDGEASLALAVPLGRFAPDGRASARSIGSREESVEGHVTESRFPFTMQR